MLTHLLRRLAHALAVVLAAATVTFALLQLAPGDALDAAFERPSVPEEARAAWRARHGHDRTALERYADWLAASARGDFGWSLGDKRPVRDVIADALPRTALLTGTGLLLAAVGGVALGAWRAWRPRSALGRLLDACVAVAYATPEFALALGLVTLFALKLALLPAGGVGDPIVLTYGTSWDALVERARHLALPAGALALAWASLVARLQRRALAESLAQDFVRTARAKGAGEGRVLLRHALRPALAPTLTLLGLALPTLAGGALVVEAVFGWPGMGGVAVRAVGARDHPLVLAIVVVTSALVAVGSLLADLLVAWADPRARDASRADADGPVPAPR